MSGPDTSRVSERTRTLKPGLLAAHLHRLLPGFVLKPLRQVARGLCYGIGWILYHSPKREQYLRGALSKPKRSLLESVMAVYFYGHRFYQDVSRYRAEVIGRSAAGDAWLEVYRAGRARAPQAFHEELEALAEAIGLLQARKVMQVGCGSGGELWTLAQRFPGVDFVGVDINEHIIRQNAADLKETPNLRWLAGDVFATDHLERERPHLVFTSGSAEYFTEGELETFIQRAKRAGAKAVCFYESITQINFDYRTSDHSTTRGMMAFNHPYGKKLRAAGAQTVRDDLIASPDNPYVSNVLAIGRL